MAIYDWLDKLNIGQAGYNFFACLLFERVDEQKYVHKFTPYTYTYTHVSLHPILIRM